MLGLEPNLISSSMLFVCTIFGCISFLPQIAKAIKSKKTDDIAISSWVIWVLSYTIMSVYAFCFTLDQTFFLLELAEGGLCLFTLLVCLKFKNQYK